MGVSPRIAVASASAAVALGLGLFLLGRRDKAPSTVVVDDHAEVEALLGERTSAGGGGEAPLIGPIPEEDARILFTALKEEQKQTVYEPEVYYVRTPNLANRTSLKEHPGGGWLMRTNSKGFREDEELPEHPDARVVVLGDSHTDGACDNRFSFANVLEDMLESRHPGRVIDVVNGGVGSHSFFNYHGAVEKYGRELAPDVVVCAVYGGNDFLGTLRPRLYFQRQELGLPRAERPYWERIDAFRVLTRKDAEPHLTQAIFQLSYFTEEPAKCELALETASALTARMAERAAELGVALVMVYLPPMWDVQLERYEEDPEALVRALRLDGDGATRDGNAWADRWIAEIRALGLTVLDLRPPFRDASEKLYWHEDLHISIAGHRRVAEELLPIVEPLLPLR